MTISDQPIADLQAKAQRLRERAQAIEARMRRRWDSAPGSFVTGGSGRRRSGLDRRFARADAANRRDYAKVKALRARAARLDSRVRALESTDTTAEHRAQQHRQDQLERQQLKAALIHSPLETRLWCGCYPTGWVWCDQAIERRGDYRRLAYMAYSRLELELEPDCPEKWKPLLASEAAKLQARRGQAYPVTTCGQTVTLGGG